MELGGVKTIENPWLLSSRSAEPAFSQRLNATSLNKLNALKSLQPHVCLNKVKSKELEFGGNFYASFA